MFVQPNTTTPSGQNETWHIPITSHVLISLSLARRLTGVRLNLLCVCFVFWTDYFFGRFLKWSYC